MKNRRVFLKKSASVAIGGTVFAGLINTPGSLRADGTTTDPGTTVPGTTVPEQSGTTNPVWHYKWSCGRAKTATGTGADNAAALLAAQANFQTATFGAWRNVIGPTLTPDAVAGWAFFSVWPAGGSPAATYRTLPSGDKECTLTLDEYHECITATNVNPGPPP